MRIVGGGVARVNVGLPVAVRSGSCADPTRNPMCRCFFPTGQLRAVIFHAWTATDGPVALRGQGALG